MPKNQHSALDAVFADYDQLDTLPNPAAPQSITSRTQRAVRRTMSNNRGRVPVVEQLESRELLSVTTLLSADFTGGNHDGLSVVSGSQTPGPITFQNDKVQFGARTALFTNDQYPATAENPITFKTDFSLASGDSLYVLFRADGTTQANGYHSLNELQTEIHPTGIYIIESQGGNKTTIASLQSAIPTNTPLTVEAVDTGGLFTVTIPDLNLTLETTPTGTYTNAYVGLRNWDGSTTADNSLITQGTDSNGSNENAANDLAVLQSIFESTPTLLPQADFSLSADNWYNANNAITIDPHGTNLPGNGQDLYSKGTYQVTATTEQQTTSSFLFQANDSSYVTRIFAQNNWLVVEVNNVQKVINIFLENANSNTMLQHLTNVPLQTNQEYTLTTLHTQDTFSVSLKTNTGAPVANQEVPINFPSDAYHLQAVSYGVAPVLLTSINSTDLSQQNQLEAAEFPEEVPAQLAITQVVGRTALAQFSSPYDRTLIRFQNATGTFSSQTIEHLGGTTSTYATITMPPNQTTTTIEMVHPDTNYVIATVDLNYDATTNQLSIPESSPAFQPVVFTRSLSGALLSGQASMDQLLEEIVTKNEVQTYFAQLQQAIQGPNMEPEIEHATGQRMFTLSSLAIPNQTEQFYQKYPQFTEARIIADSYSYSNPAGYQDMMRDQRSDYEDALYDTMGDYEQLLTDMFIAEFNLILYKMGKPNIDPVYHQNALDIYFNERLYAPTLQQLRSLVDVPEITPQILRSEVEKVFQKHINIVLIGVQAQARTNIRAANIANREAREAEARALDASAWFNFWAETLLEARRTNGFTMVYYTQNDWQRMTVTATSAQINSFQPYRDFWNSIQGLSDAELFNALEARFAGLPEWETTKPEAERNTDVDFDPARGGQEQNGDQPLYFGKEISDMLASRESKRTIWNIQFAEPKITPIEEVLRWYNPTQSVAGLDAQSLPENSTLTASIYGLAQQLIATIGWENDAEATALVPDSRRNILERVSQAVFLAFGIPEAEIVNIASNMAGQSLSKLGTRIKNLFEYYGYTNLFTTATNSQVYTDHTINSSNYLALRIDYPKSITDISAVEVYARDTAGNQTLVANAYPGELYVSIPGEALSSFIGKETIFHVKITTNAGGTVESTTQPKTLNVGSAFDFSRNLNPIEAAKENEILGVIKQRFFVDIGTGWSNGLGSKLHVGEYQEHAIDLNHGTGAEDLDAPIYAVADGIVNHISIDSTSGVTILVLRHTAENGQTWDSVYMHMPITNNGDGSWTFTDSHGATITTIRKDDFIPAGTHMAAVSDKGSPGQVHGHFEAHTGAWRSTPAINMDGLLQDLSIHTHVTEAGVAKYEVTFDATLQEWVNMTDKVVAHQEEYDELVGDVWKKRSRIIMRAWEVGKSVSEMTSLVRKDVDNVQKSDGTIGTVSFWVPISEESNPLRYWSKEDNDFIQIPRA